MILENSYISVSFESNLLILKNKVTSEIVNFSNENEFVLFTKENDKDFDLRSDKFSLENVDITKERIDFHYKHLESNISVCVTYSLDKNLLKKKIIIKNGSPNELLRVISLNLKGDNLEAGGEGLPIFVQNKVWCGIEFPAAINEVKDGIISCHEAPFTFEKEYTCLPIVFGIASDAKKEFRKYIEERQIKKNKLKIYCDWGLHDDMDDASSVLTEKLTLDNIDQIAKIESLSNMKFDYYLMDAFWHVDNDPYINFRKDTFPEGIKPTLDKLALNNFKYGLWFDINMIKVYMKNHEEYDTMLGNGSLCINEDKIVNYIRNAFIHHIKENNVKLLKLDFAYFECNNPNHNHSTELTESKQKSIQKFIETIKICREIEPELKVIAYNGWTTSLEHIGSVVKRKTNAVSPYWCFYIDYIYCGDPRASEIATRDFSNSLCYYTDAMVRAFYESYMPLSAIDDHGTMTGTTPTIYNQGKKLLRLGWLMNTMRGSHKLHLYGDTYAYNESDCEYIGYINKLFDKLMDENFSFELINTDPRDEEPYGYYCSNDKETYFVLINPKKDRCKITLKGYKGIIKPLIKDGLIVEQENNEINAEAIEIKSEGYGLFKVDTRLDNVIITYNELGKLVEVSTILLPNSNLVIDCIEKDNLYINFQTKDKKPLRTGNGCPEGLYVIESGRRLLPTYNYWSGVSWLYFKLNGASKIELVNTSKDLLRVKYTLGEKEDE